MGSSEQWVTMPPVDTVMMVTQQRAVPTISARLSGSALGEGSTAQMAPLTLLCAVEPMT